MTAVNMSNNYVKVGNEGLANDFTSYSPVGDANSDCLIQNYTTRGKLSLVENRLPTLADAAVRPTDPLIGNDAFLVSAAGTVASGVGGTTTLSAGDLLVLLPNLDPAVATSWVGVVNSVINRSQNLSSYYGTNNAWVKIVSDNLPFFP